MQPVPGIELVAGTPDSLKVGSSGRNAERFAPVVASGTTRLALMKGMVPGNAEIITCTWFATTSVKPGAVPL